MLKLYINTTTNTFYDVDGNEFAAGMPQIPYKNAERVCIRLCSKTPGNGTSAVNPEADWEFDTAFEGMPAGALLSSDNNFIQKIKGTLAEALNPGIVTEVRMELPGVEPGVIPPNGNLRIFGSAGSVAALEYMGRSKTGDVVTFELADGSAVVSGFAAGTPTDVCEALYMQAAMDTVLSEPAAGLFVFDIMAYSEKLRGEVEYSDNREVEDVAGLELLVFRVDAQTATVVSCKTFLCETFSIPVPMADPNINAPLPETAANGVIPVVAALLSSGFELQYSSDGVTEWHEIQTAADTFFHFRSAGAGGLWSAPVMLPAGINGSDGTGLRFRGEYHSNPNPLYSKNETAADAVQYQGNLWGYTHDEASAEPPPVMPVATNDYWTLLLAGGEKGADGEPGPQGPSGPQGETGQSGKSNYEIWLDAGNEGTETDFLNWLKGPPDFAFDDSMLENQILRVPGKSRVFAVIDDRGYQYPLDAEEVRYLEGYTEINISIPMIWRNTVAINGTWYVVFA